ncbi:MAG: insulinase family protein [Lachnospiraceae bacterium]|nr:insulinase family protein [Lachnospiraceae bacterium]
MKIEDLKTYQILEHRWSEDLQSDSYILEHKKTKARIALLSNEDPNKVFYIGFRTPPKDSTGVAHIVEHTVLCGSRKFPVKDPFIELAKGSLNTFLNAMTYPDKTVYPVASCNDKDFQNLMDVYLDAVLHPNIYNEEKIFRQEGWHYELETPEDELTYNGVVYNEMKGAFSSPDDVLDREVMNSLYPDTIYALESGGDPDVIPELTYEAYLDFHRKYYHPSNSYIYLYGDMDMAEKLEFIDREYLSAYDYLQVDSRIEKQKPFAQNVKCRKTYSVLESETDENATYLTYNMVMGDSLDPKLYLAIQVLDYALCSAPGAPLKQALIDRGIGDDVYSDYENGICQPFFSVVAKNARETQEEEFIATIREVLQQQVANGIDPKALYAGINHFEFKYREADFGSYPAGLMYGLQMLDSWLYDESAPFIHVEANRTFTALRKLAKERYFEELIQRYLLDNKHGSIVVLAPEKGKTARKEKELAQKLAEYKASLTEEEIHRIVANTKALREYQESEDSPEALATIPVLRREDIATEAKPYVNELRESKESRILFHEIETKGIGYVRLIFSLNDLTPEDYPYVGILKNILGLVNTQNYSYAELNNEINIQTGGLGVVVNSYVDTEKAGQCTNTLEIKCKAFYDHMEQAFELMEELILHSKYSDEKRLHELLQEMRSRGQETMMAAGHVTAVNRAFSYFSKTGKFHDTMAGIEHYRLVDELCKEYEVRKQGLIAKMIALEEKIFCKDNLFVDFTAAQEGYERLPELVDHLADKLYASEGRSSDYQPVLEKKNEGFLSSAQIQYVCRAGNYKDKGLEYTGALRALRVLLGYDYLWNQVRVKGGAYGCMCAFAKSGESYFVSYRDPNLEKTIDAYEHAAEYVRHFEADERTLTQFIIGAVSELDTPMNPAALGTYSLNGYMTNWSFEKVQKERDELLHVTTRDLQETADYIDAFMQEDYLCVVGNEGKIKGASQLFQQTENLF